MIDFGTFSSVGFIILIAIIAFLIVIYVYQKNRDRYVFAPMKYPPMEYMKDIGSKCPDYWTYQGQVNGKDQCLNVLNIPLDCSSSSYYDSSTKIVSFTPFDSTWPLTNSDTNEDALRERQTFAQACNIPFVSLDNYSFNTSKQ